MATGTGKTFTATRALVDLSDQLASSNESALTLIVCPLLDLVDQWLHSLNQEGFATLRAAEGVTNWQNQFNKIAEDLALVPGRQRVIVTTTATFATDSFQKVLGAISSTVIFIADEVHNFGSTSLLALLPKRAKFRLGLSATPKRWNDPFGSEGIVDYFGEIGIQIDIKKAIALGALAPYLYFPRLNAMSALEGEMYNDLTIQLAAVLRGRSFIELDKVSAQKAGAILTARSALLGSVESKWGTIKPDLDSNHDQPGQLIYCGVGSSPLTPDSREIELTESKLIDAGFKSIARYEAQTDRELRKTLLADFKAGRLKYLLSMKCLDEGVDIPSADKAYFIASSANPRQFIQRRGRVLRKHEGKAQARIYDYFLLPRRMSAGGSSIGTDLTIGKRELDRTLDFIDACQNPKDALDAIKPLIEMYGNDRK
jgi:superfamily II DNA or RNA helicase